MCNVGFYHALLPLNFMSSDCSTEPLFPQPQRCAVSVDAMYIMHSIASASCQSAFQEKNKLGLRLSDIAKNKQRRARKASSSVPVGQDG